MYEIGCVERLQVQLGRLKKGTKPDQYYDPAALCVVPALRVTSKGVIGLLDGQELTDVHHADHEYSKGRSSNGISFNFTSHYKRMQRRYGKRLEIGSAGENILISANQVLALDAISPGLIIETNGGARVCLTKIRVANPCLAFGEYALNVEGKPSTETVKQALQFLDGGMRGFYCEWAGEPVVIRPGDRVFIDSTR